MMDDRIEREPRRRLYGRSGGRPLSALQAARLERLLPELSLPPDLPFGFRPEGAAAWLEIGFGGGEHLVAQARAHRAVSFLAAEPFMEGVAKTVSAIEQEGLSNIRFWRGDGRDLADRLDDASIDRVFILFPDPWPKTRHRKRRLIQPAFVETLRRIVKPGGQVRFATDWADYAERALADFLADGGFAWTARTADDWRSSPSDHVRTRYQEKGLGDCAPVFLDFVRSDPD
jgi:tRNA (guanine-N7-)-methyltransferase